MKPNQNFSCTISKGKGSGTNDGSLSGKNVFGKEGAGLLSAGGNVNLTGGTISNKNENKSDSINGNGGNIYADPVANFNMSSGQISNCKVDKADNL